MVPEKSHQETMQSSNDSAHEAARRRSNFSLSFALRSPRHRASMFSLDTPRPTCEERIHYPVYNPEDPRHNPSECRRNSQNSSADSQKQLHWVQDLHRRSIRKAQSGLLSLREGLLRLSSRNDDDNDTGSVLERPQSHINGRRKQAYGISGISDASTQEDVNFGVGMYRMNSPWPSASCEPSSDRSTRVASSLALVNVSAPELPVCNGKMHCPESALPRQVPISSDEPPPYSASDDRPAPNTLPDANTDQGRLVVDTERSVGGNLTQQLDQSDVSDWETIASGKDSACSVKEDVSEAHEVCDTDDVPAEQPQAAPMAFWEIPAIAKQYTAYNPGLPHKGIVFDDALLYEHETTNSSTGSFKLLDPDAPSSYGPSKADQSLAHIRESEALVTQERLQIPQERKSEARTSIASRKCSANVVKIAFPGLYHALLEQWTRETHQLIVNSAEAGNNSRPSHIPANSVASEQSQQDPNYHDLPWSCENRTHGLSLNTSTGHRTWDSNEVLSSAEHSSTSIEDIWVQAGIPLRFRTSRPTRTTIPTRSSSTAHAHPPAEMPDTNTRHSFGLHIAQGTEPGVRPTSNDPGHQDIPQQSSNQQALQQGPQQAPTVDRYAPLSALVTGGPLGSPFDHSECSSVWTNASSVSPGATSRTSMSNVPWSPIDSAIDEEVLFPNNIWQDEYYMADGKTSNYYPDRGDQPSKRIWRQRVTDDGSIHSGPGLDRTPSSRLHVTELMAPMIFSRPRPSQSNQSRPERGSFEMPQENVPGHQLQEQTRRLG